MALTVLLFGFVQAVPAEADPAFDKLIAGLSATRGFSCSFRQVVSFAEGGEKSYRGELAVLRPGKFRWHYTAPYEQLYVSDGGSIWHYEPDLMQAERMKGLDAVDPEAMKLLDGRASASDVRLLEPLGKEGGASRYRVRIGSGPELTLAFLNNGDLYWLESKDMLGNRNRMILLEIDRTLPDRKRFDFVPPRGVDVVDLSGEGEVIPLLNSGKDGE